MVTGKELLAAFVSEPLNVAAPVTVMVPWTGTLTFTVTTIVCPTARLLAPQVMRLPVPGFGPIQVPCGEFTLLNGRLEGSVVEKATAFATWFPLFLTCHVYVSEVPAAGPPFWADPVTCISVALVGALIA